MIKYLTGILLFISSNAMASDSTLYKDNAVTVEQFNDAGLAHFSYAILADHKVIIVDPGRDPAIYLAFAKNNNASITGVIETHPHADFASSHVELQKVTGAKIYTCSLIKPGYSFVHFDEGDKIVLSDKIGLRSIFTPGHAPDAISAVLTEGGRDIAVFSGDALLIGDVGRPDLRSYSGNVDSQREQLARKMFHTIWEKFAVLNDSVLLFPTHGAGSLCGKAMRKANQSTIGIEKSTNYAFQIKDEEVFVSQLLSDLPVIPKYFPFDVALNVKGAPLFKPSVDGVPLLTTAPDTSALIIDGRSEAEFKQSYLHNAINIQDGKKFETWLGSVIGPEQQFYLAAESKEKLHLLISKAAKIGYESRIKGAFVYDEKNGERFDVLDTTRFGKNKDEYTIIDVRTQKEAKEKPLFPAAINIPLDQLDNRINEIPTGKPIVVHCESGYRSAAGSSIIKKSLPGAKVYDLGAAVKSYEKTK
jgi:glyoxylase-like metal-dependent hydrolase (beta-lactamase superfamily II)/rhodanese-related sulfurtransferase